MSRAHLGLGAEPTQYPPTAPGGNFLAAPFTRPHKKVHYCLKEFFVWKRHVLSVDLLKLDQDEKICPRCNKVPQVVFLRGCMCYCSGGGEEERIVGNGVCGLRG